MIIDVPIGFRANVVRPGRRKPEGVHLLDFATVAIAETTEDEAPVVLWWSEERHRDQVAVRYHDGSLYKPYCWSSYAGTVRDEVPLPDPGLAVRPNPAQGAEPWHQGYGRDSRPIPAHDLAARLARGAVELGPLPRTASPPGGRPIGEIGPFRSIETPLEALRSSLQSKAADLLSVDGALFVKAATPLYVVDHDWGRPSLLALWSDDARVHPEAAWPVTEWEAAAEAQRRLAGDHAPDDPSDDPVTTRRAPRPDILRADLVPSFDVGEDAVRGGARSILAHMESARDSGYGERRGAPRAVGYGRPVLGAYAGLRDALADGSGPDDLVSRLADLAEASSPHGTLGDVQRRIAFLQDRVSGAVLDDDAAFASIGPMA